MSHSLDDLRAALRARFGFDDFRPGQAEVIGHLMAGRSSAAVFATGAGKSLCYQLPATLLPGLTLVVSPLIALMKDQIGALGERGIAAHSLDSSLSADEYRAVMADIRSGAARLLYVAPERFNNERFRRAIEGVPIALFAIDEAHCISEWGHNFRPDYLKLAVFAERLGAERVLALTATATARVLDDICRALSIAPENAVRTPFYRPNLTLRTTPVDADGRDALLRARIRERPRGPAIVYVTLQRTAEEVAALLAAEGHDARAYHAGMSPENRAATQAWFATTASGIVVATIAFGMGIDKADIRYVYHYNLPKSLEGYAQEIGRAGRDGAPSICETLACVDDLVVLENFVYGDTPTRESIAALVDHVFSAGADFDISQATLARDLDMRVLVLRTLFTYLELRGHIAGGTPFYSVYELRPLMSSADMLARVDDAERAFVRSVLAQSRKARVWFHIDAADAARSLGAARDDVVRALDALAERGMLELRAKGVRNRYRVVARPPDPGALVDELYEHALAREASEIDRLGQVLALIGHDGCQVSALGAHFSEPLTGPCGHCSWCETGAATPLPGSHGDPVDRGVVDQARALRDAHPDALSSPRVVARLLCGIASPALTRARLHRHALFGAQARVPFGEVLAAAAG